jgi:hypothetical protein
MDEVFTSVHRVKCSVNVHCTLIYTLFSYMYHMIHNLHNTILKPFNLKTLSFKNVYTPRNVKEISQPRCELVKYGLCFVLFCFVNMSLMIHYYLPLITVQGQENQATS